MKPKTKRRWKTLTVLSLSGVLLIAAGWRVTVWAQESLASVGAATAIGTTLGAAGGAGLLTPGQYTRGTGNNADAQRGLIDEAGNPTAGGQAALGAGGAQVAVRVERQQPQRWGPETGVQMVRQLMTGRYPAADARRRSPRGQSAYARRLARMTPRQRSRIVLSKYRKAPVGYLSWYLPEDRYKVTSKVWQYVTTPNDRFYYFPWAPAMRLRNPSRVIGFHTWQDAMIAGYRPDPATRPTPAPQLAYFAGLTRGPNLATYFEFVYAGQVPPGTFDQHYRYVRYVATEVGRHAHTRKLVGATIEQVLGALVGNGSFPTAVGGVPQNSAREAKTEVRGPGGMAAPGAAGSEVPGAPAGTGDKREDDYNKFGSRAGSLARQPGS